MDKRVAAVLNEEGVVSARQRPFTYENVWVLRKRWGLPAVKLKWTPFVGPRTVGIKVESRLPFPYSSFFENPLSRFLLLFLPSVPTGRKNNENLTCYVIILNFWYNFCLFTGYICSQAI